MTVNRMLELSGDHLSMKRRSEVQAELDFLDLCADARVVSIDAKEGREVLRGRPWHQRKRRRLRKVFSLHTFQM